MLVHVISAFVLLLFFALLNLTEFIIKKELVEGLIVGDYCVTKNIYYKHT
jgi:hypothetical protein